MTVSTGRLFNKVYQIFGLGISGIDVLPSGTQFTGGIHFAGDINLDSCSIRNVRVAYGVSDVGIWIENPNASDMHIDNIFITGPAISVRSSATIYITNMFLGHATTACFQLDLGAKVSITEFGCENCARLAVINGVADQTYYQQWRIRIA